MTDINSIVGLVGKWSDKHQQIVVIHSADGSFVVTMTLNPDISWGLEVVSEVSFLHGALCWLAKPLYLDQAQLAQQHPFTACKLKYRLSLVDSKTASLVVEDIIEVTEEARSDFVAQSLSERTSILTR